MGIFYLKNIYPRKNIKKMKKFFSRLINHDYHRVDSTSIDGKYGLSYSMTAQDIFDGIIQIKLKATISRPAEFIVITFEHKKQKS